MALNSATDMAAILGDDDRVPNCVVRQLYRHANGRLNEPGETAALRDLEEAFLASGYRFTDLMLEMAISEGFRTLAQEANQ